MNAKKMLAVLGLSLLMATAALAQPGTGRGVNGQKGANGNDQFRSGRRGGPGIEMGLGNLDLSQEQQKMMIQLRYEHQLANLPRHTKMQEMFTEMKGLSDDPVANQKKMKKLASELGEMRVEGQVERYQFEQKIWNEVLTEEQRTEIGSMDKLFPMPGAGRFGPDGPADPRGPGFAPSMPGKSHPIPGDPHGAIHAGFSFP